MGSVVVDDREANSSTGTVSPTRNAALEDETFAWKRVLPLLMKLRVSRSIETEKWRFIVRYRTENKLVEREGTYRTLVNSSGAISCPSITGINLTDPIPSECSTDPSAR